MNEQEFRCGITGYPPKIYNDDTCGKEQRKHEDGDTKDSRSNYEMMLHVEAFHDWISH